MCDTWWFQIVFLNLVHQGNTFQTINFFEYENVILFAYSPSDEEKFVEEKFQKKKMLTKFTPLSIIYKHENTHCTHLNLHPAPLSASRRTETFEFEFPQNKSTKHPLGQKTIGTDPLKYLLAPRLFLQYPYPKRSAISTSATGSLVIWKKVARHTAGKQILFSSSRLYSSLG